MNATRYLNKPPVDWDRCFSRMNSSEMMTLQDELGRIAQAAARMSAYLTMRGAAGCGDHGHVAAVKHSNKRIRAVRKALGYTYPANDIIF